MEAISVTHPITRKARQELLEQGPTMSIRASNKAFGISSTLGYTLVKRGEYPARVLRLGSTYRVITADVLEALGMNDDAASAAAS